MSRFAIRKEHSPDDLLARPMLDRSSITAPSETLASEASLQSSGHLHKSLGPVRLWGLGVGYVISGDYFGWNLGL
ncbi:MAG TPA: hypothetical protein VG713_05705, partial [Pirellulales bacterium]|nr:hypothetical protein [Pirellulales bacterium]